MAGSLSEIKGKIVSTQKTSHITGAMQMVSAAKLTKSELQKISKSMLQKFAKSLRIF